MAYALLHPDVDRFGTDRVADVSGRLSMALATLSDFGNPEPYSHAIESRSSNAGILNRDREPMPSSRTTERQ